MAEAYIYTRIITKADEIRSMQDEELAKELCSADFCKFCQYEREDICRYIDENPNGRVFEGCIQAALVYLHQPLKEES